jgi:hypothetical protein
MGYPQSRHRHWKRGASFSRVTGHHEGSQPTRKAKGNHIGTRVKSRSYVYVPRLSDFPIKRVKWGELRCGGLWQSSPLPSLQPSKDRPLPSSTEEAPFTRPRSIGKGDVYLGLPGESGKLHKVLPLERVVTYMPRVKPKGKLSIV